MVRTNTNVSDKAAARAMLGDYIRRRAHGKAGLIDPYQAHYDRPVADHLADHLADYLADVAGRATADHARETKRLLADAISGRKATARAVAITPAGWHSIKDISKDTLAVYCQRLAAGAVTKNRTVTHLSMFCNWLVGRDRLPHNPVTGPGRLRFSRQPTDQTHKRRALTDDEYRLLLDAAERQPLADALQPRGGRPRSDGTPAQRRVTAATLTPETVAELRLRGRGRRLMYRVALETALRRGELSRVRVYHLTTTGVVLPSELTKNRKDANIPLHPELMLALRQWVTDSGRRPGDALLDVPTAANLSKLHRRILRVAGVTYRDDASRHVSFHALRATANRVLIEAGLDERDRKRTMRHKSIKTTDDFYDDAEVRQRQKVAQAMHATGGQTNE